jgi:DNA end-binding protein Ku
MSHMIWKGAISFGLVHVPVQLYPATQSEKVGFNLLDKRSIDPIGYRQINKRTGKEVTRDNIVRGFEYEKDKYVVRRTRNRRKPSIFSTSSKRPRSRFCISTPRIFSHRTARARRSMRCCARR